MTRWLRRLLALALVVALAVFAYGYAQRHPEDLPWTPLDLTQPVGAFTGRKLAGLAGDGARCQRLLDRAGVDFARAPARRPSAQCGYRDAVRLTAGGSAVLGYRPASPVISCPVAAALALWEWHVVQPAALAHLGQRVAGVEHFGSYSCRRLYGRAAGGWSEHATANAFDVAGFRLADGGRVTVLGDWPRGGKRAAFLREVRDGACDLFATVLSPDYNAAHRDHLHFDQAARGAGGWRGCR